MPSHKRSRKLGQCWRLVSTALRAFPVRISQRNAALAVALTLFPGLCWGQVDATSPQLVNFSFSPMTLDLISDPTEPLTVHIEATDDLTGVVLATAVFRSPSGAQFQSISTSPASEDPDNRIWEGSKQFPQFAESGECPLFPPGDHDARDRGRDNSSSRVAAL
jgi:hypothetical protein